jgi:hypothetical protein
MTNENYSTFDPPSDPSREELVEYFAGLPDSDAYQWELAITDLVEHTENISALCKEILTGEYAADIRLAALFAACTEHRRKDNYGRARQLLKSNQEFSDRAMYAHLRSLLVSNPDESILYAERAAEEANPHPGASHNLASKIIHTLEDGENVSVDEPIETARKHLDIALKNADYPKHRATRGLLFALENKFDLAKTEIEEARDQEDENQSDYAIRLGEYQEYLFKVRMMEYEAELKEEIGSRYDELEGSIAEMESKADELEDYFDSLRTQTLQFLGFFATLLAVIITTAQFATQAQPTEAALLILVMIGGLLTAIGGFSFTLPTTDDTRNRLYRQSVSVVLGLVLVLFGLIGTATL